ncbi:MAG: hypothetical protein E6R05_00120 [Candidatus Moraniibacteriota bacterium]|nr:MAG: hypothetical protein E6R05_00120 [Candidatus Moranbacteria bacterium]
MATVETRSLDTHLGPIYFPVETLKIDSGEMAPYETFRTVTEDERVFLALATSTIPTALWIGGAVIEKITQLGVPTYEALRAHAVGRFIDVERLPDKSGLGLYRAMVEFAVGESANVDVLFHPDDEHDFAKHAHHLLDEHVKRSEKIVLDQVSYPGEGRVVSFRLTDHIPIEIDDRRYLLGIKSGRISKGRVSDMRATMVWSSIRLPILVPGKKRITHKFINIPQFRLRVMPVANDNTEMRLHLAMNRLGLFGLTNAGDIFDVKEGKIVPPRLWHTLSGVESLREAVDLKASADVIANALSRAIYNWARGSVLPDHMDALVFDARGYSRSRNIVAIDGYREAVDILINKWDKLSEYMRERVIMRFMGTFELEPRYFKSILDAKLGMLFPNFGKISRRLGEVFDDYDMFLTNVIAPTPSRIARYNHATGGVPDNTDEAAAVIRSTLDLNYSQNHHEVPHSVSNVVKLAYEPSSMKDRTFPWMWDEIKDKVAVGEFDFLANYNGIQFVAWLFECNDKVV